MAHAGELKAGCTVPFDDLWQRLYRLRLGVVQEDYATTFRRALGEVVDDALGLVLERPVARVDSPHHGVQSLLPHRFLEHGQSFHLRNVGCPAGRAKQGDLRMLSEDLIDNRLCILKLSRHQFGSELGQVSVVVGVLPKVWPSLTMRSMSSGCCSERAPITKKVPLT